MTKNYWFHFTAAAILFALMAVHIDGVFRLPLIGEVEDYLYDARLRWEMPRTIDDRIVILDIDERSIAAEGHWPWQRDKLAELIDILFDEHQIRAFSS